MTFLTGSHYRQLFEDMGASFVPISGYGDFTEAEIDTKWPDRKAVPPGLPQLLFDMIQCFIGSLPSQYEAQQTAFKILEENTPAGP